MLPVAPETPRCAASLAPGPQLWRGGSCLTFSPPPSCPWLLPEPWGWDGLLTKAMRSLYLILIGSAVINNSNVALPSRIRSLSFLLSCSEEKLPSLWPARQGGALLAKAGSRALPLGPAG